MKIMFITPWSDERFKTTPDIGLGYLASLARNAGHEATILDCLRDGLDLDDFERAVREYGPDVAAMKAYTTDMEYVIIMTDKVKAISEDTAVILGGPHPSTEKPEKLFEQVPGMDYAIGGEGEPGFVPLLDAVANGDTKLDHIGGLIWRDSEGEVCHNEKVLVDDLDSSPLPAWDLIDPRKYKYGFSFMTRDFPAAPMTITRGCPYLCTFCGAHLLTGRTLRTRSVESVIGEMRLLRDKYGVRSIDVVDENFAFYRDFIMELCEAMIEADLGIGWNCPQGVRLDRLDEEMVRLMERAGCYGLSLGIESGSNRILKSIKKVLTVERVREQTEMIARASNIRTLGLFMMGFPDETREDIEATIELACSLPLYLAVFSPLRATPGTAIYDDLVMSGMIYPRMEYDDFGRPFFVRSYSDLSDAELHSLYRKAHRKFYFRPKIVFNLLKDIRTLPQARSLWDGFSRMIKRPVAKVDIRTEKAAIARAKERAVARDK
jgi:radical SAM superfamily enzyme YgiQ (UPF0313 family)